MRHFTFIAVLFVTLLSCAKPYYKPPKLDPNKVWSTYEKLTQERQEDLRQELRQRMGKEKRLDNLAFPLRVAAIISGCAKSWRPMS